MPIFSYQTQEFVTPSCSIDIIDDLTHDFKENRVLLDFSDEIQLQST